MKKNAMIVILMLWISIFSWGKNRCFANLAITFNQSSDANYQLIYNTFHPGADFTIAWNFFNRFNLWGGIGLVPAWGTIPEFQDKSFSLQVYMQLGIGTKFALSKRASLQVHFGGVAAMYSENAMNVTVRRTAFGFVGGIDIHALLKKRSFLSILADYIYAQDHYKENLIKPGGFRIGIGWGTSF